MHLPLLCLALVGSIYGAYTPPAGFTYCKCSRELGVPTRYGPKCHTISSSALQGSFVEDMTRWYPDHEFGPGGWGIETDPKTKQKVIKSKDCMWTCSPVSLPCIEDPTGSMYSTADCGSATAPFKEGTTCTQGCEPTRYTPASGQPAAQTIKCQNGGWTRPRCSPKVCTSAPPAVSGGSYRGGCLCTLKPASRCLGSKYNRYCSVTCPSGTKQSGGMYCSYGKWTATAPSCVTVSTSGCAAKDIKVTPTGAKWLCGSVAFGKTCALECPVGQAPDGNMPRCSSPGVWTVSTGKYAPNCLPVHCKGPSDPGYTNGRFGSVSRQCKDKPEGYECPISCPYPMTQKKGSVCGANGQWAKGECGRRCGRVSHPINGRFIGDCSGAWSGDKCVLSCNDPYKKTGDSECLQNGKWSDVYCANPNEKECAFSDLKAPPPSKGPSWQRPVIRPIRPGVPAPPPGPRSTANDGKWSCTNGVNSGQKCQLMCNNPYFPQGAMPYCRDGTWVYPCSEPPYCFWTGYVVGRPYLMEDGDSQGLVSKCVNNHEDGATWSTVNDIDSLQTIGNVGEAEFAVRQGTEDATHEDLVAALTLEEREILAKYWADNGIGEHASVAAFSRVSLLLMSAQAPPELLAGTHQAALDEIKHAKLCFDLAKSYNSPELQHPTEPGAFPPHNLDISADKIKLAINTFKEGCLSETISVIDAATRLEYTTDPKVTHVLNIIVNDESRHAGLAWNTVAWVQSSNPESGLTEQLEALLANFNPEEHINTAVSTTPGTLLEGQGLVTANSQEMASKAVGCLLRPLYNELILSNGLDTGSMSQAGCQELPEAVRKAFASIAAAATSAQLVEYYDPQN